MNKIKCSFCHKMNEFEDSKLNTSSKMKTIYCSECGRAIIVEFNKEKYYTTVDR